MNSKKAWLIWLLLLALLTSCEEVHGHFTFERNGSGVLSLKVMYPKGSKVKDIKGCREYLNQIQWNDISYEGLSSMNNPSGGDQCTYIYSFNDLDEVEKLHKALGLNLEILSIDDNYFTYKSVDKACVKDFDPKYTKSVTWSVKPPGNISSHNAEKVIGEKLTWNLSGLDCYNVSVVSSLTQPTDKATATKDSVATDKSPNGETTPSKSSSGEKTESQPLDASIVTWTTIGASIATIIATAIAYKESKKK